MKVAIQLDEKDNVATVTSDVNESEVLEVLSPNGEIIDYPKTLGPIPHGHKIAIVDIEKGDDLIKYGETFGVTSKLIKKGEWVHIHNVKSVRVTISSFGEYGI
jgi:altronate dehydratase